MTRDCVCPVCIEACYGRPGWFLPGEAEQAAQALAQPFRIFFQRRLTVDYPRRALASPVFAIAPGITTEPKGAVSRRGAWGRCEFLAKGDRCALHALGVKPYGCRAYLHDTDPAPAMARLREAWGPARAQLRLLLGREPAVPPLSIKDQVLIAGHRRRRETGVADHVTERVLTQVYPEAIL